MTPIESITNLNEETVDRIKDLVCINKDSAEGFQLAAEVVSDPELKGLFSRMSSERQAFAEELRTYVLINDEDTRVGDEINGSWKGTFHRWWLELRGTVSTGDKYAVLAEVERGEDSIKAMYEEVIKETSGSSMNDVLHHQYALVKQGHDHIRDLRDAAKAKSN